MEERYTVEDFMKYVTGWLGADSVNNNSISISEMKAALLNANSMLEDSEDGIKAYVERKDYIVTDIDWSLD